MFCPKTNLSNLTVINWNPAQGMLHPQILLVSTVIFEIWVIGQHFKTGKYNKNQDI